MGVWQEDLTMITFLLALVVYLGVTVLLLAFVAVLSRANEDDAKTFVRARGLPSRRGARARHTSALTS